MEQRRRKGKTIHKKGPLREWDLKKKTLKGTWGQSNNCCLKWSFYIIKQNGINTEFHKFTCKPQLIYSVCSFACRRNRNFISSWKIVKNTIKLYRRFLLHKTNKKNAKRTRSEMLYTFAGMTSLMLNPKLCNFVNS